MLGLLSLGPILMARLTTYEELAFFAVGMQINRMFYPLFGPVGIVLLPIYAYHISGGHSERLNKSLRMLFPAGTAVGIYATFHLWYFAEPLLKLWLGEITDTGVFLFRLFCLSTTAYLWFELARNPIDAYSKSSYNSRNILTSMLILMAAIFLGLKVFHFPTGVVITGACVLGFLVLGGLSIWTCIRLYQIQSGIARSVIEVATLNIIVLICVWLVTAPFEVSQLSFLALAGIELFALVLYFLGLYFCRQEWLMFLLEQLKRKSVSA